MDAFDLRRWKGFAAAGGDLSQPAITDQITIDSRRIDSTHALFVPLQGNIHDGHKFVGAAIRAGARYALVKSDWIAPPSPENVVYLRVKDPLSAFQEIAKAYRNDT